MTIDQSTLLAALKDVPLFKSLQGEGEAGEDVSAGRFALSGATETSHSRGEVILRANERAHSVCIVREGGVKETQTTPEGKEVILALHGPGDLFGEVLFDGEEAPTTVTTLVPSRILVIPRDEWNRLLASHPALEHSLLTLVGRRLSEAWQVIRMLSRYTTEARLKSALILLADRWGRSTPAGTEIALDITHRTLADLTGASREKVTRALGILQQKTLIQVVHRRIVIPSLDRLMQE